MIDQPPEALVKGCNDPISIGVLSDWVEEQYGIALDYQQSGWSEGFSEYNSCGNGIGYGSNGNGIGYGYSYSNGYGVGYGNGYSWLCGSGYGYPNGNGCSNGWGQGYKRLSE